MTRIALALALVTLLAATARAELREIELTIARQSVDFTGRPVEAMTVNGGIPGPTLVFREGDRARIHVHNRMDVETSVHWHGLLLPNREDGVPYLTTPPILPGTTYTYEFPLRQAGTYWYHSNTKLQEQRGVYGGIVIHPRVTPAGVLPREHVLVLSDWTDEDPNEVWRNLRAGREDYAYAKGSLQTVWGALRAGPLGSTLRRAWGRMPPMDVSDVAYDRFLANGAPESTLRAAAGERLRVRVINAAASSYFYLDWSGGPMRLVAADGPEVEPTDTHRLLIGVAETYDLLLQAPHHGRAELRATAQDGSGHASLWIGHGPDHPATPPPPPDPYRMDHQHPDAPEAADSSHGGSHRMHHGHEAEPEDDGNAPEAPALRRPGAPYRALRAREATLAAAEAPRRTIRMRLTGDMERYTWHFDGKTLNEADVIPVRRGEVLRIEFENETMMHHPLHLHGHFFRVLEGQGDRAPLKHTVDVPPMGRRTIEFLADADKDWFFHCHVLYHMKAGMSRIFHYEGSEPAPDIAAMRDRLFGDPWAVWADAVLQSHRSEGEIVASRTRQSLRLGWEVGWQRVDGAEHETWLLAEHHVDRFLSVFTGASLEHERNAAVLGLTYHLPLNLHSRAWVDHHGDLRVGLEKELDLTRRLGWFGDVEFDTEGGFEGATGLRWRMGRRWSLTASWHSENGAGAGIELRY